MALFGLDFSGIFAAIKSWLGPVGKLFDKIGEAVEHTKTIIERAEKLRDSIVGEVNAWKNFKEDIRFKQRVINLESAIRKTKELITGAVDAWHAVLDLIKTFRSKVFSGGDPAAALEETEAIVEDIESSEGGLTALLKKFPRLAKVLEKSLGVVALVVDGLETTSNAIDEVQTIVDELKRIRLEIEKLDTIFLSQSNKRKRLYLADGGTVSVRVGHLHPS